MTSLTDIFVPPWCLSCRTLGDWLCDQCRWTLELLPSGWCGSCGRRAQAATTLCLRCAKPLGLTRLASAFAYEGTVEQVLRAVKYRPARIGLRELLTAAVRDRLVAAVPKRGVIVPIPLHRNHVDRRGFNQAELIARVLLPNDQQHRVVRQLKRTRDRPAQVGLSRANRRTNMIDAFQWAGPSLTGQVVCIVDDVVTTGTTLAAAAHAVRLAGARQVVAITLSQTPPNRTVV